MKKRLLFSFCLFSFLTINAQQDQASVEDGLFSVNILTPGLEYEYGLTKSTTLDLRLGTGFSYFENSYFGEDFGIYPIFNAQYRYYYNLDKRLDKGKNIRNNSANYIALSGIVQSGKPVIGNLEYNDAYFGVIGPVWGLQRYYDSGFKLDLNLGAGYGFNESGESYLSLLIGFRLGWLLSN
ncbi:hypothetical protein DET49_1346 [Salegentibacter sp. 24]|uniref:hypothetical protein n=1 Tax=Salegentibacter sp. 24 TaxID=2183986 RepID=UPI00105FDC11|nr:hypothetical protein [Salegentibacter sp. 24]TDN79973.1 hypothetical protein DET49_1346 [Salegentibacter sp. 24]